jgi:hypothetical protein
MIAASMNRVAFACLLAGGCGIAFAPIFVRLSDTGPVASAFWRCGLAVPVLWIWVLARKDKGVEGEVRPRRSSSQDYFSPPISVWHSRSYTSVANATVLATSRPSS